ncbi:uncharacterized protein BT62DRAFT_1003895 [Guyanagaster necrorhizus]|uniref:Uncharacterized protein n=1 Tax=Guyanagaster necrorhizus TaxID=856835 RepID=A0A9P8AU50_9AGAR|nr:uncharacterized protein BT62DRAFT_1003895 [Guyanagaster necrorhizus MCA 3950]KAG7448114.1 hypothetical protein BT62DRAFT_1003895 [Guyanagaster necrorhizus MCA 3950]
MTHDWLKGGAENPSENRWLAQYPSAACFGSSARRPSASIRHHRKILVSIFKTTQGLRRAVYCRSDFHWTHFFSTTDLIPISDDAPLPPSYTHACLIARSAVHFVVTMLSMKYSEKQASPLLPVSPAVRIFRQAVGLVQEPILSQIQLRFCRSLDTPCYISRLTDKQEKLRMFLRTLEVIHGPPKTRRREAPGRNYFLCQNFILQSLSYRRIPDITIQRDAAAWSLFTQNF